MSVPFFPLVLGLAVAMLTVLGLAAQRLWRAWPRLRPRLAWALLAGLALAETGLWLGAYAALVEPRLLHVRRVEIVSENWRGAPITIAALSDTHVPGPHMNVARVGRIVARVNRLRPDLVVLLGDYASGHEHQRSPGEQAQVLGGVASFAGFNAPLGVIGVIGNHDVWYSRASIIRAMEEAGVATLWDRHALISRPGGDVVVAGLADGVTGEPDYAAAVDGAPAGADLIVLAHTPDSFAQAPAGAALMLGAHSHCGQVTIPFLGRPVLPIENRRYACGRIDEDGKIIFVTGGIGTSILPVRFLNPPEVVLITLRGAHV
jgi:predicted MPP superfamily phosphohydrolase